jgi:hypothetical protein
MQLLAGLAEAQLVSFFVLAVVLVQTLHSIVGKMDQRLVDALLSQLELVAAGANVAFFEEVALDVLEVDHVYQHPKTDVELPVINQERSLDVLLYHVYG